MPAPRVGVLGGTFDPPHLGHLLVASEAHAACGLDEVLLVPAGAPWQKAHRPLAPVEDRVRMTELAVDGDPRLRVSRVDVDREGPTYSVDTVAALRAELGADASISLVLGADALAGITGWHRADELIADPAVSFVVYARRGSDVEPPEALDPARLERLDGPLVDVSSTDVRARVAAGRPIRYLVPDAVEDHVRAHGLYRAAA
jgi:nicotinate-nucleotide adenylyltransferase